MSGICTNRCPPVCLHTQRLLFVECGGFTSFSHGAGGTEFTWQCRRLETRVRSLGPEDALEEEMATNSSILAWRIPMDRGAWRASVLGVAKRWTRLT